MNYLEKRIFFSDFVNLYYTKKIVVVIGKNERHYLWYCLLLLMF
jgi:hypothetical protein